MMFSPKTKIYDRKAVVTGLIIAAIVFSAPFWLSLFNGKYGYPELAVPTAGDRQCVEPKERMRAEHMTLLNTWRDMAVREGRRTYVASDGKEWEISLQKTCHQCHTDKANFCDKCHTANNVNPYCWNCHVAPRGNK